MPSGHSSQVSFFLLVAPVVTWRYTLTHSVAQLCLTLSDSMNCSPPGSSVHGIIRAGILDWVAIFSSRKSSQPRDWTHFSCIFCIGRQILLSLSHLGSPKTYFQLLFRENSGITISGTDPPPRESINRSNQPATTFGYLGCVGGSISIEFRV